MQREGMSSLIKQGLVGAHVDPILGISEANRKLLKVRPCDGRC